MINTILLLKNELAIKWLDGGELFILFDVLRSACPCAWCSGEKDVFGNKYIGSNKKLSPEAYQLIKYERVGLYGIRFFWKDGHRDGIYTFDFLKSFSVK